VDLATQRRHALALRVAGVPGIRRSRPGRAHRGRVCCLRVSRTGPSLTRIGPAVASWYPTSNRLSGIGAAGRAMGSPQLIGWRSGSRWAVLTPRTLPSWRGSQSVRFVAGLAGLAALHSCVTVDSAVMAARADGPNANRGHPAQTEPTLRSCAFRSRLGGSCGVASGPSAPDWGAGQRMGAYGRDPVAAELWLEISHRCCQQVLARVANGSGNR